MPSVKERVSRLFRVGTAEHRELMTELSEALYDIVISDYLMKSQGFQDSNGNRWPQTKKGLPVMIDTGWLISQLDVVWRGNTLRVTVPDNLVPYAKQAMKRFPIWPEGGGIPKSWKDRISEIVTEHVTRAAG